MKEIAKDRNGEPIYVGSRIKWIRDETRYTTGKKKGQIKSVAYEFDAGIVVELPEEVAAMHDTKYWAQQGDHEKKDLGSGAFEGLPPGMRFTSMLENIEVVI